MARSPTDHRVAVFGPDLLLSVTIEARGAADDLHLHPAGQGVWVARMAAELGAWPILCGFAGGETGAALTHLIGALPGEHRLVPTAGTSGGYVIDRRASTRQLVASALRPAPARHEIDDLVAATCAAALGCAAAVLCNPYPSDGLPDEIYDTLAGSIRAAGVPLLVDLSSPRLDRVLAHEPDLVKCNDWELAEYISGPVDGQRAVAAAQRLSAAGARTVIVTRAERPVLVVPESGEPFEVVPPPFPHGFREGCGDAMTGAIAAAWARGMDLRAALVLGAAAGAGNFLRHGLGTGRRAAIEELAQHVTVRPLAASTAKTAAAAAPPGRSPRAQPSPPTAHGGRAGARRRAPERPR
ncbi:MAG TPA: PfkB family carbohydrate kinase [Solirubrobacteraceae bacterium]|nr:PfkB family carbohydrate kinase [Solirubrobacteraceae bacterium]